MALRNILYTEGDTILDTYVFNQRAASQESQIGPYADGDEGIYVNAVGTNLMPEGRKYVFYNNVWFLNVISPTFTELKSGYAQTFRENLNSNFNKIGDQADTIDKNLDTFRKKLAKAATSGLASDVIETETKQFVSAEDKSTWNKRALFIDQNNNGVYKIYYDNGSGTPTDVTTEISTLIGNTYPRSTSNLESSASSMLVPSSSYLTVKGSRWIGVAKSDASISISSATSAEKSVHGKDYTVKFTNAGITEDMIPMLSFRSDFLTDVNLSPSSVCETKTGYLYFGVSVGAFPAEISIIGDFVCLDPYSIEE